MKKVVIYLVDRIAWVILAVLLATSLAKTSRVEGEAFMPFTETTATASIEETPTAVGLTMDTTITVWEHEGYEPTSAITTGGGIMQMTLADYVNQEIDFACGDTIYHMGELLIRTDAASNDGYDVPFWLHEFADDCPTRPIRYGQFRTAADKPIRKPH